MLTKVLIADHHKIFREALIDLLQKQPDLKVIGEADNGQQAVKLTNELMPDIIIMEVAMPNLNGIEATRQITSAHAKIKILVLSMLSDKKIMTQMLEAGASGYILKDCSFKELIDAMQTILSGQTFLTPDVMEMFIQDYKYHLSIHQNLTHIPSLSPREREVLQLLAEGNKTREIAVNLCISMKTVETHRKQIMDKLNIHSIANLTKFAIREGMTELEI